MDRHRQQFLSKDNINISNSTDALPIDSPEFDSTKQTPLASAGFRSFRDVAPPGLPSFQNHASTEFQAFQDAGLPEPVQHVATRVPEQHIAPGRRGVRRVDDDIPTSVSRGGEHQRVYQWGAFQTGGTFPRASSGCRRQGLPAWLGEKDEQEISSSLPKLPARSFSAGASVEGLGQLRAGSEPMGASQLDAGTFQRAPGVPLVNPHPGRASAPSKSRTSLGNHVPSKTVLQSNETYLPSLPRHHNHVNATRERTTGSPMSGTSSLGISSWKDGLESLKCLKSLKGLQSGEPSTPSPPGLGIPMGPSANQSYNGRYGPSTLQPDGNSFASYTTNMNQQPILPRNAPTGLWKSYSSDLSEPYWPVQTPSSGYTPDNSPQPYSQPHGLPINVLSNPRNGYRLSPAQPYSQQNVQSISPLIPSSGWEGLRAKTSHREGPDHSESHASSRASGIEQLNGNHANKSAEFATPSSLRQSVSQTGQTSSDRGKGEDLKDMMLDLSIKATEVSETSSSSTSPKENPARAASITVDETLNNVENTPKILEESSLEVLTKPPSVTKFNEALNNGEKSTDAWEDGLLLPFQKAEHHSWAHVANGATAFRSRPIENLNSTEGISQVADARAGNSLTKQPADREQHAAGDHRPQLHHSVAGWRYPNTVCRNWKNRGACSWGANCKWYHPPSNAALPSGASDGILQINHDRATPAPANASVPSDAASAPSESATCITPSSTGDEVQGLGKRRPTNATRLALRHSKASEQEESSSNFTVPAPTTRPSKDASAWPNLTKSYMTLLSDRFVDWDTILQSMQSDQITNSDFNSYFASNGSAPLAAKEKDSLGKLFEKYRDSTDEEDKTGVNGTMRYLQDLGLNLESAEILVPLEIVQAPALAEMSKEAFVEGWKTIGADTIPKQKAYVAGQLKQLSVDMALFKRVYRHTFICSREPGQKALPLENALVYWEMIFSEPGKPWITGTTNWTNLWIEFLKANWTKTVNKDMWNQTFEFFQKTMQDETLSFWSEDGAWPGVIDEFVAYVKEKRGDLPDTMETD